jgi:rapamycin-insensitive companion of mTOR
MYDFRTIRSLVQSMLLPLPTVQETVIDMVNLLLRIKSPGWAQSFLAGRRLTTYGRVTTLKSNEGGKEMTNTQDDDNPEQNFVEHYTALLLAVFIKTDLLPILLRLTQTSDSPALKRKATLLIGELLKMSSRLLPSACSSELQLLPELFAAAADFSNEKHFISSSIVYQISSVSRTLYRSTPTSGGAGTLSSSTGDTSEDHPRGNSTIATDDATFRQLLLDSGVLNSSNYTKWNWEVVVRLMDGPLQVGKRLEEAAKGSKFLKRLMSFYRPFKYRFSEIKSTRNTQKYVKAGCALMHALLQSPEGVKYLADNKLLRQIAECLAQCDPVLPPPLFLSSRLLTVPHASLRRLDGPSHYVPFFSNSHDHY